MESKVVFEKARVKYKEGDFVEFRVADEMPAIGLLLALSDNDHANVQWMFRQNEVDEACLRNLEQTHGVSLLATEIFFTNQVSPGPIESVLRKVTVLFAMAGIRDEEIGESVFDDGEHYLIRFHLDAFEMSFSPLSSISDKAEAQQVENLVRRNPYNPAKHVPPAAASFTSVTLPSAPPCSTAEPATNGHVNGDVPEDDEKEKEVEERLRRERAEAEQQEKERIRRENFAKIKAREEKDRIKSERAAAAKKVAEELAAAAKKVAKAAEEAAKAAELAAAGLSESEDEDEASEAGATDCDGDTGARRGEIPLTPAAASLTSATAPPSATTCLKAKLATGKDEIHPILTHARAVDKTLSSSSRSSSSSVAVPTEVQFRVGDAVLAIRCPVARHALSSGTEDVKEPAELLKWKIEGSTEIGEFIGRKFIGKMYLGQVIAWAPAGSMPNDGGKDCYQVIFQDNDKHMYSLQEVVECKANVTTKLKTPRNCEALERYAGAWRATYARVSRAGGALASEEGKDEWFAATVKEMKSPVSFFVAWDDGYALDRMKTVFELKPPEPAKQVREKDKKQDKDRETTTSDKGPYGKEVLHRRVKIYWPSDKSWFEGVIDRYNSRNGEHHVTYDDLDQVWHNLGEEKWKWADDSSCRESLMRYQALIEVLFDGDW